MNETGLLTELVRKKAAEIGFSRCGFAEVSDVDNSVAGCFDNWLASSFNAGMAYMGNYSDKRKSPQLLVENSKSIISVALNYFPEHLIPKERYQISRYAYGKDYHDVMKTRLSQLLDYIKSVVGDVVDARVFCDTAPVLERYWAWRAGLGWIGRNTSLIIPGMGSYFFLGEIICNVSFDYDTPMKNRCGNCRRCIESCPTSALVADKVLDARKCLSYLTIENREEIPDFAEAVMGNRIYGCDTCQNVCPWNRFAVPTQVEDFALSDELAAMTNSDWDSLTVEDYRRLFKGSAVKRAKFEGLKRNIRAVNKK